MRTRLMRGKFTLLFMMLGILLAVPTVALAADLLTEAELSSQVSAPTDVAPNATTNFDIKVWARGNINNPSATGDAVITKAYTMGAGGITANTGTGSTTTVKFKTSFNYGTDGQTCPAAADVPPQPAGVTGRGCATDPFVVPATLTVGNLADETNGTLTVEAVGTQALNNTTPLTCTTSDNAIIDPNNVADTTDCTKDQGFVEVVVPNHAPTVSTDSNNVSGNEGSALTNSGAFSDQDTNDTLTITKKSGAGTVTPSTTSRGAWSWSHTPNDNGTGTVEVEVSDGNGGTAVDSFTWTANNVDPTGTLGNDGPKAEGSAVTVSFSNPSDASSVDAASLHYSFDCQGNSLSSVTYATASTTNSKSCTFNDNGSYNVTGVIIDKDGGRRSDTTSVTVTNADPTIGSVTNNGPINEGQSATITVNGASDPAGANDPLSYEFDCDNNGTYEVGPQPGNTHQCSFNDDGTPTVGVRVSDGDGGSATGSTQVTVNNLPPTINSVSNNGPVDEGQSATITVNATDPAGANDPLSYSFDCNGDGDYTDAGDHGSQAASNANCSFADNGSYTVNVRVTDGDGGEDTDSTTVTVNNANPTFNGLTASSENVLTGGVNKIIFTANASDVPADPITYTWSGGDAASSTATGNTYKAGFSTCGDKTVTVTASDGDGGTAQMTKTVKAWNAIFQAPIKDGSVNTASKGQVVPVKATIGCGTTNLTTLQPVIQLLNGDATPEADSGTTAITTSVSSADTGQFMRLVDGGYLYNLQTPSAAAGTKYTIRVNPWGAPPAGSTTQQTADWNLATGMYALLQIRK